MIEEKPRNCLRIAHISDLHFARVCFNPLQFLSKRWVGNFNSLLTRKNAFLPEKLFYLPDLFKKIQVDHIIISGDLTTTSLHKEFKAAKELVDALSKTGIPLYVIPGNHDHYTKSAYKKRIFYDYFPSSFDEKCPFNLKDDGLTLKPLGNNWSLIALDTTLATPLFSSYGYFSKELESKLEKVLQETPKDHKILLTNHFPFFNNEVRKILKRAEDLKSLLQKFPQVKLFLHGHNHRQILADLRANNLPIILDSGSTSHKQRGGWNLIDITEKECFAHQIETKKTKKTSFKWVSDGLE